MSLPVARDARGEAAECVTRLSPGLQRLPPPPAPLQVVIPFGTQSIPSHGVPLLPRCCILWLGNANSIKNGPEFHFSLPFGKQFSIHKELPLKGSVLLCYLQNWLWHHQMAKGSFSCAEEWTGQANCLGRWGEIFQPRSI